MKLGNKISGGAVRDCFEVLDCPDLCAKVQRDRVMKHLPVFNISLDLKIEVFLLLRFGETDMNVRELRVAVELMGPVREFLPEVLMLDKDESGKTQLIASRPRNYDGTYSQPLSNYGSVADTCFWRDINQIALHMACNNIIGFDIFQSGCNVLVQEVNTGQSRPVLIDVKSVGLTIPKISRPFMSKQERIQALESQIRNLRGKFHNSAQLKPQISKKAATG